MVKKTGAFYRANESRECATRYGVGCTGCGDGVAVDSYLEMCHPAKGGKGYLRNAINVTTMPSTAEIAPARNTDEYPTDVANSPVNGPATP